MGVFLLEKIDKIKKELKKNNVVKFKLYSLEYIIEINIFGLCISPITSNNKIYYENLSKMFEEYKVYNESLIDNIDKIIILDDIEYL